MRDWAHRHVGHPDKVILRLDFRNAFNLVDRAAMLRAVRQDLPGLTCWTDWCYSHHSRLLYAGETIASTCGVQQGDPLGPLLFSLALQPALVAARGHCDVCFAYLDDVVMAGMQANSHKASRLCNMSRATSGSSWNHRNVNWLSSAITLLPQCSSF